MVVQKNTLHKRVRALPFLLCALALPAAGWAAARQAELSPRVPAELGSVASPAPVAAEGLSDLETLWLPAVSGLTPAACFVRPVSGYASGDGCLEFLARNPDFANKRHAGDDFCAVKGTRVNAVAGGKVMYARAHSTCPNWGNLVAIEHLLPNGSSVVSLYGHVVASVQEGDLVVRGQQVGTIGRYSCWSDHVHVAIAQRDWGSPVGSYASWVKGYLSETDSVSPYKSPWSFLQDRLDCPPTVTNLTYTTQLVVHRIVTARYSDPEGRAPVLQRIRYQYKEPTGSLRTGSGELTLSSGSAGSGTYRWSKVVYGSQFKFYTEWRDAGGHSVRSPASGWAE